MQRCSKVEKYDAWISIWWFALDNHFFCILIWPSFCKLSLLLYLGSGCFVQALPVCLFVCFVLRLTWSYWRAWSQRGQPPHSFPSPREEKMLVIFCLRKFERRRLPKRMMMVDMILHLPLQPLPLRHPLYHLLLQLKQKKIKWTNFWQNVSQPV